jgi:hypothetical protein
MDKHRKRSYFGLTFIHRTAAEFPTPLCSTARSLATSLDVTPLPIPERPLTEWVEQFRKSPGNCTKYGFSLSNMLGCDVQHAVDLSSEEDSLDEDDSLDEEDSIVDIETTSTKEVEETDHPELNQPVETESENNVAPVPTPLEVPLLTDKVTESPFHVGLW